MDDYWNNLQCQDNAVVTVNPTPIPTLINDGPKCVGSTVTLTATGGGTYAFSAGATATGNTATVTTAGIYTVTVTANGCTATSTTEVSFTAIPTPTAGSNSPICAGSNLNLTSSIAGATYAWAGPNGFTATTQNPSISAATTAASGTYMVDGYGSSCSSTTTTNVTVALPVASIAGATTYCLNTSATALTASGGGTYLWNDNSTASTLIPSTNIGRCNYLYRNRYQQRLHSYCHP